MGTIGILLWGGLLIAFAAFLVRGCVASNEDAPKQAAKAYCWAAGLAVLSLSLLIVLVTGYLETQFGS